MLLAEDNAINQKLIKRVLNNLGLNVTLSNIHKINMDIQMPVMGGIDVTKAILEYEEKKRKHYIPIIALTANTLTGDREKYMNSGTDGYISKPLDLEKISLLLQEYSLSKIREAESKVPVIEENTLCSYENLII